ncbi:hypothetical protein [Actinotalea sp. Marseille-Q4924]|uniref:hypothetical protein n=1 Tax=Actinotalea sp. Marseille-Q4924 TaxID=2866571 RepID=UPI001CE3C56D|nr:hypothetical protein [Actinotalea sp. Marseille-Q4924]
MIRVLRRQLSGDAWSLVLLALVVAGLVALTVGWPRALDRLLREDLVSRAEALPTTQRDLTLTVPQRLTHVAALDDPLAEMEAADRWVTAQVAPAGPALAAVLREPQHQITRAPFFVDLGPRSTGVSFMTVALSVGPRGDDLRLVEGEPPRSPDVRGWLDAGGGSGAGGGGGPLLRVDVVLTGETARWMGWEVGETRTSRDPVNAPFELHLSGLVEAADAASPVWEHLPGVLEPAVDRDDSAGWTVHAVGHVDPAALGALMVPRGVQLDAWYPVDPRAVGEIEPRTLAAQMDGIRAASGLRSDLLPVLDAAAGRERTVTTLLGTLVAGLIGVAAGVLWLVADLAVDRRRAALLLLRARGASSSRLAALVGVQALVAVAPGAAVGLGLALAVPGRTEPADLVLPGALVPAAVVLMVAVAARVHAGRRRRPLRRAWLAELLVPAATVVALTATSGTDPLVTVLPIAVGMSAALVARRAYRWLAGLALREAGRRDLGTFLGVARAARAPAAGLVPVLALTLGVSTAGLAVTAVATMTRATERSAVQLVGADLRLDLAFSAGGRGLDEEQVAAAAAVPGVAAVATVADARTVTLHRDRTRTTVDVRVVDGDALAAVQRDLPGGAPAGPGTGSDVALVAPGVPTGGVTVDAPAGPLPVDARLADGVPGVSSGTRWVVVDAATWADAGGRPPVDRLLVRLDRDADPDGVAGAIVAATGARLTATTLEQASASITDSGLVSGVRTAMLLVAGGSLALVAAVLALLLVADAPARGRTAAMLATLGAPTPVHRRLVLAEVLGPVVVAGLAGAAAGAVLPSAVLRVADLRPFTGAAQHPPVVADPGLLLAAGAGLAVVVAVGALLAVAGAQRVSPVRVLREGAGG